MNFKIKYFSFLLTILLFSLPVFSKTQNYGVMWLNGVFIGPFSKQHKKWKYYLQTRLAFIDDKDGFDEGRIFYGAGYQLAPNFTAFVGAAYFASLSRDENFSHENVLWQQFIWDMHKSKFFTLSNRSRLEERLNTLFAPWALRWREQFTLKIPYQNTAFSFITFDEVFFNLNHPFWVSKLLVSQNRYFVGIEKAFTKTVSLDVGYINQARLFDREIIFTNGIFLRLNAIS